jgi:hypothetical protein
VVALETVEVIVVVGEERVGGGIVGTLTITTTQWVTRNSPSRIMVEKSL